MGATARGGGAFGLREFLSELRVRPNSRDYFAHLVVYPAIAPVRPADVRHGNVRSKAAPEKKITGLPSTPAGSPGQRVGRKSTCGIKSTTRWAARRCPRSAQPYRLSRCWC